MADLLRRAQGVKHLGHDFRRARPAVVVGRLDLQELGARQDDPQLVVQLMEQQAQLLGLRFGSDWLAAGPPAHAWEPVVRTAPLTWRGCESGSRHSESAKMRMAPPAVRMYSTFPAEIQL